MRCQPLANITMFPPREYDDLDGDSNPEADTSSPEGSHVFSMESYVMRDRLQVSLWGLNLTAEGIVAIAAALLIVVAVLAAYRF
jgi:hypothetical protein